MSSLTHHREHPRSGHRSCRRRVGLSETRGESFGGSARFGPPTPTPHLRLWNALQHPVRLDQARQGMRKVLPDLGNRFLKGVPLRGPVDVRLSQRLSRLLRDSYRIVDNDLDPAVNLHHDPSLACHERQRRTTEAGRTAKAARQQPSTFVVTAL